MLSPLILMSLLILPGSIKAFSSLEDVRAFIEGKETCSQNSAENTLQPSQEPYLYVFVSSSMSQETLKKVARDIQRVQGVLVFRGLIGNSFKKTAKYIQELGEGVWVDPTLFEAFQVKEVPTFIIVDKPYRKEEDLPSYDSLRGNVTISFALEKLVQEGETQKAKELWKIYKGEANE